MDREWIAPEKNSARVIEQIGVERLDYARIEAAGCEQLVRLQGRVGALGFADFVVQYLPNQILFNCLTQELGY